MEAIPWVLATAAGVLAIPGAVGWFRAARGPGRFDWHRFWTAFLVALGVEVAVVAIGFGICIAIIVSVGG